MSSTKKIRVAVLLGGNSNEKEISLDSGRNVVHKLSSHHYETLPVFVSSSMQLFILTNALLVRNSTQEIELGLAQAKAIGWNDLPSIADFVFIALHGGLGENGGVQGALEMLNIPYNGSSVLASALCMDKFKTTRYLASRGFYVPMSVLIPQDQWVVHREQVIEKTLTTFTLPLIVKPHDDGCSVMVQKISKAADLAPALDLVFAQGKTHVMIEECIHGMELTVGVLGNEDPQALPPSQALAAGSILSIEEKFLPGAGENQTPAPLPAETLALVQRTMEKAYAALGCKGYARIDCFYQRADAHPTGTERVVILEVNSLPGLTPATCIFHQAAEIGLRPADFLHKIIQLGLQEHTQQMAGEQQHRHQDIPKESKDILAR